MVTKVDLSERPFKVEIDENKNVLAETIIIATGAFHEMVRYRR